MSRAIVVGGGISGMAVAHGLARASAEAKMKSSRAEGIEVLVLETEPEVGGKIRSRRKDGYLLEWGPHSFQDSRKEVLALADAVGLNGEILPSSDLASKRYVYSRGKLRPLPLSPQAFLASSLLSPVAKLRVLMELRTRPGTDADETIAAFARRHIGSEATEVLVDAFINGVFAGDPASLSVAAAVPRLVELDRRHGSLIKGMLAMRKAQRSGGSRGPRSEGAVGAGGRLTTFREGLQALPLAVAAKADIEVRTGAEVERVRRGDGGSWVVRLADGTAEEAEAVVVATPSYASAFLLEEVDPGLAGLLDQIEYPPVTVVCFGYELASIGRELDGFGYLIPKREKRRILGSLWLSSVYPGRAPEGHGLLETFVGGARDPETPLLPDHELEEVVKAELRDTMRVRGEPVFTEIIRHERAIPQYNRGHSGRLQALDDHLKHLPGLFLAGNAFRGVSMPDCVLNGTKVASQVAAYLEG